MKTAIFSLSNTARFNLPSMLSPSRIPPLRTLVPHKLRRKWRATKARVRAEQSPASSLTALETSFSLADTVRALRAHQWSLYDGQYVLLAILGIFCLCVMQFPSPLLRTLIASLLMAALVIPVTSQFFLPFLPVIGWLVLFYSCK